MPVLDLLVGTDQKGFGGAPGYLVALGTVAVALCLQYVSWPALHPFPLLFYLPAVCLAALYGGAGPGAFAAVLSGLCIFYFAWPGIERVQGWAVAGPFAAYTLVAAACILALNAVRNSIFDLQRQNDEASAQLREADDRLKALGHQMTNNMQAVASLLTLQKMKLRSHPWAAASLLDDARQRVVDMSRITRRLSERTAAAMGFTQYLQLLCADLQAEAAASSHEVIGTVSDDVDITEPEKLMALSVLIGEAVSNALKHAFREHQGGAVHVAMKRIAANQCQLTIQDNGRGLPQDIDPATAKTGGFLVMQAMAVQLGGRLESLPSAQGTAVVVIFEI
jgi:two-component system, sensor histidine kinase PdtaS